MLKPIFIVLFNTLAVLGLTVSIYFNWFSTPSFYFYSSLLASVVVIYFFAKLFLFPVARTDKSLIVYSTALVIALIFSLYNYSIYKNIFDVILTLFITIGWFLYVYWYSKLEQRIKSTVLEMNKVIPDFPIQNTKGKEISSYNYLGNPMVILFYRGNWCPLCMAQIKEISEKYKEIEKMGASILLISNQPHENSEVLSKKFDVNLEFLVDYKNRAAEMLGINHEFGIPGGFQVFGYDTDTAMPTLIVTDEKGKVIFLDQTDNYRLRPEPDTFIQILKNHYK